MGELYERIREATPVQLPERPAVSEPLAALLRGLLDKNPSTRLTLAEVRKHAPCLAGSIGDEQHTCGVCAAWATLLPVLYSSA
jgi:hypothetical protein